MPELLLALDVGTTSTRAMLVEAGGRVLASAARSIATLHPGPDRAEQDAEAYAFGAVVASCRGAAPGEKAEKAG